MSCIKDNRVSDLVRDIRNGRHYLIVVPQRTISRGPSIIGVEDRWPALRVRREDVVRDPTSRWWDLRLRGGCGVRLATTAERAQQRAEERRRGHLVVPSTAWGGRYGYPAPFTEDECAVLIEAQRRRARVVAEGPMTPEQRREQRDALRPGRPGARRRRTGGQVAS